MPTLFATFIRAGGRLTPVVFASQIAYTVTVPGAWAGDLSLPPLDSPAGRTGAALGAYYCIIYFSELSASLGFPPGLRERQRLPAIAYFAWQGRLLGGVAMLITAARPRLELYGIPVLLSVCVYSTLVIHVISRKTKKTFNDYPVVEGVTPNLMGALTPYAIHVTDIHLVAEGEKRIEGGSDGIRRLGELAQALRRSPPTLLLITGDLTDRGSSYEYNIAMELLRPLRDAVGTKILLAPGNHDLGTAYSATNHIVVLSNARYTLASREGIDGLLLVRYLEVAAGLYPRLRACNGRTLKNQLSEWRTRDARFEKVVARIRHCKRAMSANSLSSDLRLICNKFYHLARRGVGTA